MLYRVTKRFIYGPLAGITIVEVTRVKFAVGFRCEKPIGGSGYEVLAVEPV